VCRPLRGRNPSYASSTTNIVLIYRSDAARLGYDVIIAEDAVGDRDIPGASGEEVTKMVMVELGDAFGTIVKSSEIK
jgi:hypothetical protein